MRGSARRDSDVFFSRSYWLSDDIDSRDVEFFTSEAGASPTEGVESYKERTYGVLPSAGRTR
jgi:hypothetical protein